MRIKMLMSSLVLGASLLCAPAVFAQNVSAIGDWPVRTDSDSMHHFERMACFHYPQQVNCFGFDNSAAVPMEEPTAPVRPATHPPK